MRVVINDRPLNIKCDYMNIPNKSNEQSDYYEYNCSIKINADYQLNIYEREKIAQFIRERINDKLATMESEE